MKMACVYSSGRLLVTVLSMMYIFYQGSCQDPDNVQLISGDVTLGAMFGVNGLVNGRCGDVDLSSIQEVVAVTWLLDRLNAADYVRGVKIGLQVVRTCSKTDRAVKGAMDLVSNSTIDASQPFLGILGPQRTAEAVVVSRFLGSLPPEQHLLQISGSATGKELSDRTLHSNFFRVIAPDTIQVKVMAELLEELDWNYVAIVYNDDDYGRSAATELLRQAEGRKICVPLFKSLPIDPGSANFSTTIDQITNQIKTNSLIRGLVFIGGGLTSNLLITRLSTEAKFVHVILSEAIGLQASTLKTSSGDVMTVARGALLTSPQYFNLPEFRTFWNNLWTDKQTFNDLATRNPWLASYFQKLAACTANATGCWESAGVVRKRTSITVTDGSTEGISLYIWYDLKATAVFAALLKQLHTDRCGTMTRGLCPNLSDVIKDGDAVLKELQKSKLSLSDMSQILSTFTNESTVEFDTDGNEFARPERSQYTVYNFQAGSAGKFVFKQVGVFSANNLTLDKNLISMYSESGAPLTWSQMTPAQCDVNHDCLQCQRDVSGDVVFLSGDFYIIALAPINSKHTTNPLKCGQLQIQAGADLAEAIMFAVNEVNKKTGDFLNILPNRRVGLVVINSCSSNLLVKQRLLDLHSGRLTLPDGRNTSFLLPYIMGYVGAYTSENSIAAASTLTDIQHAFVQVSGASTAAELKDRSKYPYFMRLVPPDDPQSKLLLQLLERMGSSYVQVVYDNSSAYAAGLFRSIQNEINTGKYNVCIAQAIATTPHDNFSQYRYIIDQMRTASSARAVIVILHFTEITKTLDAILPLMGPSDGFIFLCTDSWGRRQFLIDGRPKMTGSLVLSQEIAFDKFFQKHFEAVDLETSLNPWLRFFWEERLNCFFDKSFLREGKTGPCPANFFRDYVQDFRAPIYINAVYALVQGFHRALSERCGALATSKCAAMTSAVLVEAMKQVKLDLYSTGRTSNVFDSNGDGLIGYKVLQVAKDMSSSADSMIYQDVGAWTHDGLTLNKNDFWLPPEFTSACPNPVECKKCYRPAEASPPDSQTGGVSVGWPIGLSVFFIVVIIALIIIIVICYRRFKSTKAELLYARHLRSSPPSHQPVNRPLPDPIRARQRVVSPNGVIFQNSTSDECHYYPLEEAPPPCTASLTEAKFPYITPAEPSAV